MDINGFYKQGVSPYDIIMGISSDTVSPTTGDQQSIIAVRSFSLISIKADLTQAQTSGSVIEVQLLKNGSVVGSTLSIPNNSTISPTLPVSIRVEQDDVLTAKVSHAPASTDALGCRLNIEGRV